MNDPSVFYQEQIERIRATFDKYDKNQTSYVGLFELVFMFNELGLTITKPELEPLYREAQYILDRAAPPKSEEEEENEKRMKKPKNVVVMLQLHKKAMKVIFERHESLATFVSLGGKTNTTGAISREKLNELCKQFELRATADELIKEMDIDKDGSVSYNDLRLTLESTKPSADAS